MPKILSATVMLVALVGTAILASPSAQASPFCQEKEQCCEVSTSLVSAACWGRRWDDGSIGATEFCAAHVKTIRAGCVLGMPEDNCVVYVGDRNPCRLD